MRMTENLSTKQMKRIPWSLLIGVFLIAWVAYVALYAIATAVSEKMTLWSLTSEVWTVCLWIMIALGFLKWRKIGGDKWGKTIRTGFWVALLLTCLVTIPFVILTLSL